MNDKIKIINYVRDYRVESNMTQEQLAEKIGVSRQSIISIENGRYVPSLILAMKIAQFYFSRVEELFVIRVKR